MQKISWTCSKCICKRCLYRWSGRCPYGICFDDHRAKVNPYEKGHPDEPPRTFWTHWETEQEYWCRGGVTYPVDSCDHFVEYHGQNVKDCLEAVVNVFQDGYIQCSLVNETGCEECYKRFRESEGEK